MNEWITGAVSLLLLAVLAGCVSPSAYNQALRERQAARNDLERVRAQNDGLHKQMIGLKESIGKLEAEIGKANAQRAALHEAVVKERQAGDARQKDLERQIKELTASKKALSQELEVAKQRYEDSLKIQKRQAKELKEREQLLLIQPPTQPAKPAEPLKPESNSPATP